jgi:hypothetical protein
MVIFLNPLKGFTAKPTKYKKPAINSVIIHGQKWVYIMMVDLTMFQGS